MINAHFVGSEVQLYMTKPMIVVQHVIRNGLLLTNLLIMRQSIKERSELLRVRHEFVVMLLIDRRKNMGNAKKEIIEHIEDRQVKFVKLVVGRDYSSKPQYRIEGDLDSVLPKLNFEYDSGYGGQELFGYIWYEDGTWSERGEYNGSEWWEHKTAPDIGCDIAT